MSKRIYKQKCKDCETDYYIEDLKLIAASSCPKCNGKGLHISEHKVKSNKRHDDAFDSIMYALPDWIPPQTKTKEPLLTIELQDETAVPKVFYEGKEIELKQNIFFEWETDTNVHGGLTYAIEHVVNGKGYPIRNRIERRVKGHATD